MQVMDLLITNPAVGFGIAAVPTFRLLLARPMGALRVAEHARGPNRSRHAGR
jgi:hypothetical protein